MNNKVQNVLLGVLAIGLIGITVAYVHFGTVSAGNAQGYATAGTLAKTGETTIAGDIGTLKAPGDSITYTFDIENAGDINAIIDTVTGGQSFTCTSATKSVADAVCKDLTYSIKYTDGNATIAKGDKLAKATNSSTPTKKNVTLTLTYKSTATTVASEDVTVTADPMTITYVQDAK